MGVRQKNISGIFRRFLFSFLLAGAATILVLGVIVQILTIKAVIHPANYDEQQLEQKREEIQTAEKVEEKILPYGTRFGVFDNSGRWLYGTFTESEREEVWEAVLEEKNEISSGYLKQLFFINIGNRCFVFNLGIRHSENGFRMFWNYFCWQRF